MPNEGAAYLWVRAGVSTLGFFCSIAILAAQCAPAAKDPSPACAGRARSRGRRGPAPLDREPAHVQPRGAGFLGDLRLDGRPIGSLNFIWSYLAVSAMILALAYAVDVGEREERIHALQALAHAAQLRAPATS